MRVMVTNDDGVASEGIGILAAAISEEFGDVVVVAPSDDRSGSGAAIGPLLHEGNVIDFEEVELKHAPSVPCFAIDGTPALAVILARLGAFGSPPDLVVSGINPGNNTGRSVLHSGTVGAALTAATFGISGLAVSIGAGRPLLWESACTIGRMAARLMVRTPIGTAVNLNVPNLPLSQIKGVRSARLAPFGSVRTAIVEAGTGKLQVELRSTVGGEPVPMADTTLLREGMATVTILTGLRTSESSSLAKRLSDSLI
ncbi:MAG TPA: 5'/3'-nucleotidase SurE [Acidimicrobiales bacterium]|nr:5'/3'-nucleotidase SurE [Acidimicrobiales bacterium]